MLTRMNCSRPVGRAAATAILLPLVAGLMTASAANGAAPTPAEAFGALPAYTAADLSPDGLRLSYLAPRAGGGNILFVVDLAGAATPAPVISTTGKPEWIERCHWVAATRLACRIGALGEYSGYVLGATRWIALDADAGNLKVISERPSGNAAYVSGFGGQLVDFAPGTDGAVLMSRWHVPDADPRTLVRRTAEGYSLDLVDTRTLRSRATTPATVEIGEFITDGLGQLRIIGSTQFTGDYVATGITNYRYRLKTGGDWRPLGDHDSRTGDGFNPFAVDPDLDRAYGYRRHQGRLALFAHALDGSDREELVFAHPAVDVGDLIRIGRKRRVVGVGYTTDATHAHYFDAGLARLRESLSRALPGAPAIGFAGASDDEQRLLVSAASDVDPGTLFLLDRSSKQLRPLLRLYPGLADKTLANVRHVFVKAGDGTQVPAYLTLPPGSTGKGLPALVMPHGGPSARDEWGFDWLAQYFAHQGFAVLQPNYRGSAGYGDAWLRENGFKSWRIAIGDVVDSGRWLVAEGIADPGRLAIFGWSYGGYAALQSGVIAPGLFKAIVAVAPVTDFATLKAQYARSTAARLARFEIGSGPQVQQGSPYRNAGAITVPVQLFHGTLDQNVDVVQSRMMADALKDKGRPAELHIYPGLAHSLWDGTARADMLTRSEAFIRAAFADKPAG